MPLALLILAVTFSCLVFFALGVCVGYCIKDWKLPVLFVKAGKKEEVEDTLIDDGGYHDSWHGQSDGRIDTMGE